MNLTDALPYIRRVSLAMLIGLAFGFALNEISFLFIKESNRAPMTVTLSIPEGTAAAIERGEEPPSIPEEMIFVVGDVLVVENDDNVDHQLGPMWIPEGGTASLALEEEQNFLYTCTFNPSSFFGLEVQEPVTLWTRISGMLFSGVPFGAILALYSLIIWPIKKEKIHAEDHV
jgi:hypothetical protein